MTTQGRPRKLSTEQAAANAKRSRQRWNAEHKSKSYRYQKKSRARSFILKDATLDELVELSKLIDQRREQLQDKD